MKQSGAKKSLLPQLSLQQCKIHRSATQPGEPVSLDQKCKCCALPFRKKSLSVCFPQTSIMHLGPGPILFFRFLLITLLTASLPMLAYFIPCTIRNVGSQFILDGASQSWVFKFSNVNATFVNDWTYSYVLCGIILLITCLIPICIKLASKINEKIYSDQNNFFYSQYLAVLIKLQKAANYSEQIVVKTINQWIQFELKLPIQQADHFNAVEKIYFHFNNQLYQNILKQINQYQNQKHKQEQPQNQFENTHMNFMSRQIKYRRDSVRSFSSKYTQKQLYQKLQKSERLKQKIRNRELEKTNKLIVVMKNYDYVHLLKQNTKQNLFRDKLNKLVFPGENKATVYDAPFPCQIDFTNQHYIYGQKRQKRILSWVVTIIVVIIGSGLEYLTVFVYCKIAQNNFFQFSGLVIAAIFYLISQLANILTVILVEGQWQPNMTQKQCSQCNHLIFTSLFLKCISIYISFNFSDVKVYQTGGLIQTSTWFLIVWGAMMLVRRLVNIDIIYTFFNSSKSEKQLKQLKINQKQANKLFESAQNKINVRYAQLLSFVFSCFAFCSIIPISLLICALCLLIDYIIQRICFVDIYRQPRPSSDYAFFQISKLFWRTPILLILGQFYLIYLSNDHGINANHVLIIILSILLAINLITLLVPLKLLKSSIPLCLTYFQIKQKIINCYCDFNPLYSIVFPVQQIPKSSVRAITKSQLLIEQLNTMSKSLEHTLRDKLFNNKNPPIEALLHRQDDSMYFEFDNKIVMPEKQPSKVPKLKVPPIFKQSKQDSSLRRNQSKQRNKKQLVRLTQLVSQQQAQIKTRIKQAIKGSINKIQ